jgi:hypothetical protein
VIPMRCFISPRKVMSAAPSMRTSAAPLSCWRRLCTTGHGCAAPARRNSVSCTSPPTRCSARSSETALWLEQPLLPKFSLCGEQGGRRPPRAAWHRTYGVPTIVTNCCNNYEPRPHADPALRQRRQHARLAIRRRPRGQSDGGAATWPAGQDLLVRCARSRTLTSPA